jgi:hypothetical protein
LFDVSGDNVLVAPGCVAVARRPLFDLRQLAYEEDSHALALGARLHDPQRLPLLYFNSTELFNK